MDELPFASSAEPATPPAGPPELPPLAEETPAEAARHLSRQEDQALIAALKQGDGEAFRSLVLKYERQVYNHCLRMVYDEEESYDLTQEIFLRVYRNIGNYQHNFTFYTWLYRITVNCCIDYLRKRKRQPPCVSLSQPGPGESTREPAREQDFPDETYLPDKSALNRELGQVLERALAKLSVKLREIIVLKEVEGLSYEEIAEILNCSRGTVKSRLFRARERLKELLGPYFAG
jgi:RNA polymerase sigma-70 factor (ECF subfamily)